MKPKASPGLLTPQKPVKENRGVTLKPAGVRILALHVSVTYTGVT